jgi:hypothetical protein
MVEEHEEKQGPDDETHVAVSTCQLSGSDHFNRVPIVPIQNQTVVNHGSLRLDEWTERGVSMCTQNLQSRIYTPSKGGLFEDARASDMRIPITLFRHGGTDTAHKR